MLIFRIVTVVTLMDLDLFRDSPASPLDQPRFEDIRVKPSMKTGVPCFFGAGHSSRSPLSFRGLKATAGIRGDCDLGASLASPV